MKLNQEYVEQNLPWFIVLVLLVVSVAGLVEIVPLFFQNATTQPVRGLMPYTALQLTGRDIYIREGCNNCHSQMIRPFRVGSRYSDDWHRVHLNNPRDVVPESNMPGYPWLATSPANAADIEAKMRTLRTLGVPYTDADITQAQAALVNRTEQDALIAYLQNLGLTMKNAR
jgi:cytochrome c oxidase cbb3-type subunit 2